MIDFSDLIPRDRKPTKKEAALFRSWVKYLSDSKLTKKEVLARAKQFTEQGHKVPK